MDDGKERKFKVRYRIVIEVVKIHFNSSEGGNKEGQGKSRSNKLKSN